MKKIILVLGLMLGVCLGAYGYDSEFVYRLYSIMDEQHKAHPGLVWVEVLGSAEYGDEVYPLMNEWLSDNSDYGYKFNRKVRSGNATIFEFVSEDLLKITGFKYNEETGLWDPPANN